jgi:hypothetical protein
MESAMNQTIEIIAKWNDTQQEFTAKCVIGYYDEADEYEDDTFFFFEPGERIIGDHLDFTVIDFVRLDEVERA